MDVIFSSISKNSSDFSGSNSDSSGSRSDVKEDPKKIAVPEEGNSKDPPKPSGITIHEIVAIKPKCSVASTSKLYPVEQTALSKKTVTLIDEVPDEPPVNYTLPNVKKSRISRPIKDDIPKQITLGKVLVQKGSAEVEADTEKPTSIDPIKSSLKRSAAEMERQVSPDSGNETGSDCLQPLAKGKIRRKEGAIFKAWRKESNENKFSSSSTTLKEFKKHVQSESRFHGPPEKRLRVEANIAKDGTYNREERNSRKLNTQSNFSAQQPSQNRELKSVCSNTARLKKKVLNLFGDDCDESDCLFEQPKPVSNIAAKLESTIKEPAKLESLEGNKLKAQRALSMTIYKEYHELFDSIQKRAKLIVALGGMLEQKQRMDDKHMQMALKEKILALREELNSERFQKQQERLNYLRSKLNTLKISIEEN